MYLYSRKFTFHFCPILTKFWDSRQIFIRVTNTNIHGNSSSGNRTDVNRYCCTVLLPPGVDPIAVNKIYQYTETI